MALTGTVPVGKAPVLLATMALVAAVANALLLAVLVPEQRARILAFGLALAVGPALVLLAFILQRPRLAGILLIPFVLASLITGFTVGFWDLVVAVPLCAAAVGIAISRQQSRNAAPM